MKAETRRGMGSSHADRQEQRCRMRALQVHTVCVSTYTLSVSVRTGLEGLGVPALEEAIERAAAPPAAPAPPLPIIFRALRSLFLRFSRGTGVRGGR